MKKGEVRLSLEVFISSPGLAEFLVKSLKPDNMVLPEGLKLEIDVTTSSYLRIFIEAEDVGTVMNTINDLFTCLQPAIKLLSRDKLMKQL